MNRKGKKFISPGAWFSLVYPQNWYEFEDSEGTFLFYNPDQWTGNFRISAFKADSSMNGYMNYGASSIKEELKNNSQSTLVKVAGWDCAYSKETFQEGGVYYTTHIWITGIDNIAFECTFTVSKGGEKQPAEDIIATLEVRKDGVKYPLEIIPIRLLEIGVINDAFEWAVSSVKKQQKKDFTGTRSDIIKLQQLIDNSSFNIKKRDVWYSIGFAMGVIAVNEIDGLDWVTVIDNGRETAALRYQDSPNLIYPHLMIWGEIQNGKPCDLEKVMEEIEEKIISENK